MTAANCTTSLLELERASDVCRGQQPPTRTQNEGASFGRQHPARPTRHPSTFQRPLLKLESKSLGKPWTAAGAGQPQGLGVSVWMLSFLSITTRPSTFWGLKVGLVGLMPAGVTALSIPIQSRLELGVFVFAFCPIRQPPSPRAMRLNTSISSSDNRQ